MGRMPFTGEDMNEPDTQNMGNRNHSVKSVLSVKGLKKHFPVRSGMFGPKRVVRAVDGISLEIFPGETLAVVGESGCGKSTAGRAITRLIEPTDGRIILLGRDITDLSMNDMLEHRSKVQIVFQDPYTSLNPRLTVGQIIREPLENYNIGNKGSQVDRQDELLTMVGLLPEFSGRFPHQLSGGQRQRVGIARALALNPELIVLDEAVSALDVSVQAQIINLLSDLQLKLGLAYLFISHDLAVVNHISHRVVVMYLGLIMEEASTETLFQTPLHPYTRALISSVPVVNPRLKHERIFLQGEPPNPASPPAGCPFNTRCSLVHDRCRSERPALRKVAESHSVACFVDDLQSRNLPM
jgi:oligopeptide/dipeptide ABC transporter ATP-binding protein